MQVNSALREKSTLVLRGLMDKDLILSNKKNELLDGLKKLNQTQGELKHRLEVMKLASSVLQNLVDLVSTKNIERIESLVNSALQSVFPDEDLKFKIIQDIKRNTNIYSISILKNGVEGSVDSYGGGVLAVIAFILKILCNILSGSYPLLVLDESLSFLSEQYIPNASKFIKELSKNFNLPIILVTHQPLFSEFCDMKYSIRREGQNTKFVEEPS